MIYQIDFDPETRVLISHMHPVMKRRIRESLRSIAHEPFEGKPLKEELLGLYAYRVGLLRIIYSIDTRKRTVHVVAVGPRKTVYDELSKLFKPPSR